MPKEIFMICEAWGRRFEASPFKEKNKEFMRIKDEKFNVMERGKGQATMQKKVLLLMQLSSKFET